MDLTYGTVTMIDKFFDAIGDGKGKYTWDSVTYDNKKAFFSDKKYDKNKTLDGKMIVSRQGYNVYLNNRKISVLRGGNSKINY